MVFRTLVMLHHSGCSMSEQPTPHSVVSSPADVWLDNVWPGTEGCTKVSKILKQTLCIFVKLFLIIILLDKKNSTLSGWHIVQLYVVASSQCNSPEIESSSTILEVRSLWPPWQQELLENYQNWFSKEIFIFHLIIYSPPIPCIISLFFL